MKESIINFTFNVNGNIYQKMQEWCNINISKENNEPNWNSRNFSVSETRGLITYRIFTIRYEEDAMAFKLKWL